MTYFWWSIVSSKGQDRLRGNEERGKNETWSALISYNLSCRRIKKGSEPMRAELCAHTEDRTELCSPTGNCPLCCMWMLRWGWYLRSHFEYEGEGEGVGVRGWGWECDGHLRFIRCRLSWNSLCSHWSNRKEEWKSLFLLTLYGETE